MMKMMVTFVVILSLGLVTVCGAASDEERVKALESVIQLQRAEGDILKARIQDLERRIADIKSARVNKIRTNFRNDNLLDNNHMIAGLSSTTNGNIKKRQVQPQAAFHVYMNDTRCYHLDSAIAFDRKPVDVGGGFSHDNNIYDVPYAGTYVFTWTVSAWPISGKIVTELYLNNFPVGVLTSDPDIGPITGNGIHPSTGVVIIKVAASDHVSVRMKNAPPSTCGGDVLSNDSMVRSTFSGWMLSATSQ